MKLITSKDLAKTVADRWEYVYPPGRELDKSGTLLSLRALGDDPDPEQVERIIGNETWTKPFCFGCKEWVRTVIEFGSEWDPTVDICPSCLKKALSLVQ